MSSFGADPEPALRHQGTGAYELWRACSERKMRLMVRRSAAPGAAVLTTLCHGECFLVHKTGPAPAWVRLAPCEHWARDLAVREPGYVCVEGKTVNRSDLGTLVEYVCDDEAGAPTPWPYAAALARVSETGLAWAPFSRHEAIRPAAASKDAPVAWLRRWLADDAAFGAVTAPLCRLNAVLGDFPANAEDCWAPLLRDREPRRRTRPARVACCAAARRRRRR